MRRLLPFLLLTGAAAATAGGYAGSRACVKCHPAQSETQSQTGHAQALRPAAEHRLIDKLPLEHTSYRPPDFRLSWFRKGSTITVSATTQDGRAIARPVQWAFGAGGQAITFVSQWDEDRYIEHHLSWYSSSRRLALTPGHRATAPASLEEALGVIYRTFAPDAAILRCFGCHSTGPLKLGGGRSVQPFEAGVGCEACHGPGDAHVQRPVKSTIYNPGSMACRSVS